MGTNAAADDDDRRLNWKCDVEIESAGRATWRFNAVASL